MLKKILMASAVLSATLSQFAFAYSAPYVGASIGIAANTVTEVNNLNYAYSSFRGVPASLFVGFGAVLYSNFYLAGEVTGTVGAVELNNNGLKSSYGYGASILPGFLLCDHTITFLRLGIVSSRFPTENTSSTGGQIGLGLQTSLTQNVDLRGEYDFVAYKSFNINYPNTPELDTSVTPRSDQFVLALVYKFD